MVGAGPAQAAVIPMKPYNELARVHCVCTCDINDYLYPCNARCKTRVKGQILQARGRTSEMLGLFGCTSELSCSLNGQCSSGTCKCDPGWTGAACDKLSFQPASRAGGLHNASMASWGGNIIYDVATGRYHMFAAAMRSMSAASNRGGQTALSFGLRRAVLQGRLSPRPESSARSPTTQQCARCQTGAYS